MPNPASSCRLCSSSLQGDARRGLCVICDDFAQYVALQTNRQLDRIVGDLQTDTIFLAASRHAH